MENTEENCKIWKVWKITQLNSEMIWKIWKKGKLNSEMIWKIWKKGGEDLENKMVANFCKKCNY